MRFVAQKPCSFEGQKFFIGEEIPVELVANPQYMKQMGVIAVLGELEEPDLSDVVAQVVEVKFEIPIHAEEGDLPLQVTNEELTVFTDILQTPVSKTEDKQKISALIQKVESVDLLILLDALDGRKFVKEEAQARAKVINAVEGD